MIDPEHALPLTRQSGILEISRSSLYYQAVPVSERDLELMRLIDEIHLKYPFYGSRRIRDELRDIGHEVGRRTCKHPDEEDGYNGLISEAPALGASSGAQGISVSAAGLEISRANHVWAADITYMPMARGFCYLVAIMDWASRRVLAWRLSNTLDASFCTEALEEAIRSMEHRRYSIPIRAVSSPRRHLLKFFKDHGISISMDGKGAGWTMCS